MISTRSIYFECIVAEEIGFENIKSQLIDLYVCIFVCACLAQLVRALH
jgi:hypothetical protein